LIVFFSAAKILQEFTSYRANLALLATNQIWLAIKKKDKKTPKILKENENNYF